MHPTNLIVCLAHQLSSLRIHHIVLGAFGLLPIISPLIIWTPCLQLRTHRCLTNGITYLANQATPLHELCPQPDVLNNPKFNKNVQEGGERHSPTKFNQKHHGQCSTEAYRLNVHRVGVFKYLRVYYALVWDDTVVCHTHEHGAREH